MSRYRQGGVSIFIVIIAGLLVSVVTIGFIRLINRDYQDAARQDLSQSAYDSAQVGVEDAKRALLAWQNACSSGPMSDCEQMTQGLNLSQSEQPCNLLATSFNMGDPNSSETLVESSSGDSQMDQAYTCVKIDLSTDSFLGRLSSGESKIIPLKATDSFNKVRLSWFNQNNSDSDLIDLPDKTNLMLNMLPPDSTWPANRPSILRAQFVSAETSTNKTIFAYPAIDGDINSSLGSTIISLGGDTQTFTTSSLSPVRCDSSLSSGGRMGYACSVVIDLLQDMPARSSSVMNIAFQYGSITDYRVELLNNLNNIVTFDGVQPSIDSTGRANDLFRRVESRVEIGQADLPAPINSVYTSGVFCKAMTIRDTTRASSVDCR